MTTTAKEYLDEVKKLWNVAWETLPHPKEAEWMAMVFNDLARVVIHDRKESARLQKIESCLQIAEKALLELSRPVHICQCGSPEMRAAVRIASEALAVIEICKTKP